MHKAPITSIADVNPPLGKAMKDTDLVSFISMSDVRERGGIKSCREVPFRTLKTGFTRFQDDDILFAKITPCMENGKGALVTGLTGGVGCGSTEFHVLRAKPDNSAAYIYQLLQWSVVREKAEAFMSGSAGQQRVPAEFFARHNVCIPSPAVQKTIATILTSIDTAIETTEALIEKYQQIKAGLMHDLFTRGVLPNGQLRPPREQAPELYRETAIGWLPKEWQVEFAERVLESIADGPFGSNLKTEHYVVEAGVRVVRLQNISSYEYADGDKAYISAKHASFLIRNKVVGGDVLIAGLGDERYPVARACCYPDAFPPALNKADCFRARCNTDIMSNMFLMLFLNSEIAQRQTRRYEQGVTRPRINTGNMKRLLVCVPEMNEQKQFVAKFEAMQTAIHATQANLEILRQQKLGLMQDLLTGKVEVKVEQDSVEPVNA
jgi:type I restriction enzyme S subunit